MSAPLRRKPRKLVVARGSLFDGEPPFAAILSLDQGAHRARHLTALAVTLGLHASLGLAVVLQRPARERSPAPRAVHREIATSIIRAAPPPVPPKPPERIAARTPRLAPRTAPPPPAQAARAIALEGPADLTSFDLVIGQGKSYAGGVSSSKGTSRVAVHEQAQLGAPPARPARTAPDLSRAPSPLRHDWSCAWPEEAQDSDLRDARVTLRVHVSRDGDPAQIDVVAAPAGGFAEAAKACAGSERYRTALDPNGVPIDAATPLFNVHFLR